MTNFIYKTKPESKYSHRWRCPALQHESKKEFTAKLKEFYSDVKIFSTHHDFYVFFELASSSTMFKLLHADDKLVYQNFIPGGSALHYPMQSQMLMQGFERNNDWNGRWDDVINSPGFSSYIDLFLE